VKPVQGLTAPTPGLVDYREAYPESRNWNGFRENYKSGEAYKELIGALAAKQRGLCAYCEIDVTDTDRRVEHFHPKCDTQSLVNWTFDPSNLLAA
jgi:uncharacterized protein (TIGR02646 family)